MFSGKWNLQVRQERFLPPRMGAVKVYFFSKITVLFSFRWKWMNYKITTDKALLRVFFFGKVNVQCVKTGTFVALLAVNYGTFLYHKVSDWKKNPFISRSNIFIWNAHAFPIQTPPPIFTNVPNFVDLLTLSISEFPKIIPLLVISLHAVSIPPNPVETPTSGCLYIVCAAFRVCRHATITLLNLFS